MLDEHTPGTDAVPSPAFDDAAESLPDGEMVAFPAPSGADVTLWFASPFEAYLCLDGRRVQLHDAPDERLLLEWLHRRLPPLYRALSLERGLRATLAGDEVRVVDVVDLETQTFVDHVKMRQTLTHAGVVQPSFAILGAVPTRSELRDRLRGMYASGTAVEVRAEEGGRAVARRRVIVGRE